MFSQVDWNLVAARAGYSNGNCAVTRFQQIKKAIGYTEGGALPTPSPVKGRVGKKEKVAGSGTNNNASKVTKSSPTKGGGRKKSSVMKADPDAEDFKEGLEDSATAGLENENEEIEGEYAYHTNAFENAVVYYDSREEMN